MKDYAHVKNLLMLINFHSFVSKSKVNFVVNLVVFVVVLRQSMSVPLPSQVAFSTPKVGTSSTGQAARSTSKVGTPSNSQKAFSGRMTHSHDNGEFSIALKSQKQCGLVVEYSCV